MVNQFIGQLSLLIKSRQNLLLLETEEEFRAEYTLRNFVKQATNRTFFCWDFVTGFSHMPVNNKIAVKNPFQALDYIENLESDLPALIILKDFQNFFDDLSIIRKIKLLERKLKGQPKTIIFLISEQKVNSEIQNLLTNIDFPLPTRSEIQLELEKVIESLQASIPLKTQEQLIQACLGLSLESIRLILSKILISKKTFNNQTIQLIYGEKIQILNQNQILQYWQNDANLNDVGGLEELKSWLKVRENAFSDQAREYGLPNLRGIVLVGLPGTGKSLAAKAISGELNLPLLQLDVGKLFGGIVGESESRIREMIKVSETLSPCVIWIDEIDKAFSKTTSTSDSGTSSRVLSTFLTWLAEKQSSVFIVATANDIQNFPKEMFRKGRFDKTFVIDLPTEDERKQIFNVLLTKKRPDTINAFNLIDLAKQTKFFTGADIQQIIIDAMYKAFSENREFNQNDLIHEINTFKLN
jgi:ATP-dependent 26S proteasome regulatory subunit